MYAKAKQWLTLVFVHFQWLASQSNLRQNVNGTKLKTLAYVSTKDLEYTVQCGTKLHGSDEWLAIIRSYKTRIKN